MHQRSAVGMLRTLLLLFIGAASAFLENEEIYRLKWAAALPNYQLPSNQNSAEAFRNAIRLKTRLNEEYYCLIPETISEYKKKEALGDASHLSEMWLLKPLFDSPQCAYRIESYWSYELCHGRHLRQFHDFYDASGKLISTASQSHFLGYYKERSKQDEPEQKQSRKQKTIQIDTVEYTYYPLEYTDGEHCDLTNHPRRAVIKYVCNMDGRGEIITIKETSTCEYELVVSTSLLCEHPRYDRRDASSVANIFCHPSRDAPALPADYLRVSREPKAPARILPTIPNTEPADFAEGLDTDDEEDSDSIVIRDGNNRVVIRLTRGATAEAASESAADTLANLAGHPTPKPEDSTQPDMAAIRLAEAERRRKEQLAAERFDSQLLREFVSGRQCLDGGGSTWWQYQVCFKKDVTQFHAESNGAKNIIVLGTWNQAKHMQWIESDPKHRPKTNKNERKDVSQLYSDGDYCGESGKKRSVEVKFRCPTNQQSAGVSLMLLEPQVCEYILVAESRIFCGLNPLFDDNGLLPTDAEL